MPSAPRPPRFALYATAGVVLAAVAGYVNAVTILSPGHFTATHVTGTVSRLAAAWVDPGTGLDVTLALGAIVAFLVGSAVSGAVLDSTRVGLGRRYGVLLMLEGAALATAAATLPAHVAVGICLAAFAAGMQNGLATLYSQAIVRTTHVTGIVTDLGVALGKLVARRGVDGWRVQLYLGLLAGFVGGGILGAEASVLLGPRALYLPATLTGAGGLAYFVVRQRALSRPT